jgi:hypothetical protein
MDPRRTAVLTTAVGAVLGVLVSISSVGAGAIGVTALILLYPQLPNWLRFENGRLRIKITITVGTAVTWCNTPLP